MSCSVHIFEEECEAQILHFKFPHNANNSQHSFIPTDQVKLRNLLSLLADRGFIIFLCDRNDLGRSWVIIDIKSLIHEVYGTLFAPNSFHQHHMFVSNIGIAPMSSLQTMFP